MVRLVSKRIRMLSLSVALCVAGGGATARGVTVDFESPAYSAGNLVSQDGWVFNSYIGSPNGTVAVSTNSPLAGTQSVLFEQANTNFGSDVSKSEIVASLPGNPGIDSQVSFLMSAVGNAANSTPNVGVFITPDGFGGWSPIFVRINGASFEVVAPGLGFVPIPGLVYAPGDVLKVGVGVDYDAQSFKLDINNMSAGGAQQHSQVHPFDVGWGTESGSYRLDVGLVFRQGAGRIDDLSVEVVPEPMALSLGVMGLVAVGLLRRK